MKNFYFLFHILIIVIYLECKNKSENNWFPLKLGNKWSYKQSSFQSGAKDSEPPKLFQESSIDFELKAQVEINKIKYWKFESSDGYRKKIIRYEDGNYFQNNRITSDDQDKEFIFLKDNLSRGDRWEYISKNNYTKIIFTVSSIDKKFSLKNKFYEDTIEITREYKFKEGDTYLGHLKSKHVYAKGIGEIYSYIPYPVSGIYADDELILEKFSPSN